MAEGIQAVIDKASSGRAGGKFLAVKYLRQITPEVAAFIALRAALDSVSIESGLQKTAIRIGAMLETEARLVAFEQENKDALADHA